MKSKMLKAHASVLAASVLLGLCLAGCGGKTNKDFIPETGTARRALQAALAAWQNGAPAGQPIEGSASDKMVVELFDGDWQSGQKLTQFEIVSEIADPEGPRQFSVKLTLAGQPEQSTTYYVAGIKSQFKVFSKKEYEQRALQM